MEADGEGLDGDILLLAIELVLRPSAGKIMDLESLGMLEFYRYKELERQAQCLVGRTR